MDKPGSGGALGDPGEHSEVREENLGPFGFQVGTWGALTGLSVARGMMGVVGRGIIWINRAVEHHGSSGHSCSVCHRVWCMMGNEVMAGVALHGNCGA